MVFQFSINKKTIGILLLCLVASACSLGSKKEKFAYIERPVETLYADAAQQVKYKRYDRAVLLFEEVERQHPYSAWARRAMLMKAFAYYQDNSYDEAIQAADQFISLHPGNKDAAYAYYLKAICHYERIRDTGRDQNITEDAAAALTDVIRRYPDTEYARDARLKLDLTFDHLAGKEMYVGRYYLKDNKHISAINRFKVVVDKYQTTNHVPEALHRLVEAYLELGIVDEARAAAAVLGYNYPGSRWYEDSYRLFERRGILIDDDNLTYGKSAAAEAAANAAAEEETVTGEDAARPSDEELASPPEMMPEPGR